MDVLDKAILNEIIRLNRELQIKLEKLSETSQNEEVQVVSLLIAKSQQEKELIFKSYL